MGGCGKEISARSPVDEAHIAYIFNHYERFMTPVEREAWMGMGLFGVGGSFGPTGRSLASTSDQPAVRELAGKGRVVFRRDVAERIVCEHREEIQFNYCPKCRGLCRTPKAQQCTHCKHHWHAAHQ
jgi:hypothetical protein